MSENLCFLMCAVRVTNKEAERSASAPEIRRGFTTPVIVHARQKTKVPFCEMATRGMGVGSESSNTLEKERRKRLGPCHLLYPERVGSHYRRTQGQCGGLTVTGKCRKFAEIGSSESSRAVRIPTISEPWRKGSVGAPFRMNKALRELLLLRNKHVISRKPGYLAVPHSRDSPEHLTHRLG